jgi:pimeloyl-ACP methyl ester carboxylesterase
MFGWADAWLRAGEWDMRASLHAITCPVLVIQGRDDEFGTIEQVDAIAQGVGGPVETLVLDHCGHAPHREKRKEVLAAVTRFIQRR